MAEPAVTPPALAEAPTVATQAGAAAGQVRLALPQAPQWLHQLPVGTQMLATLLANTRDGTQTVQTAHGPLTLPAIAGLRAGQAITLIVMAQGAQVELELVRHSTEPPVLRPGAQVSGRFQSLLPAPVGQPTGTVWQAPAASHDLQAGTVLNGRLVLDAGGVPVVRTPGATFAAPEHLPAQIGARLKLSVLSTTPQPTLALLSQRPPWQAVVKHWIQSFIGHGGAPLAGTGAWPVTLRIVSVQSPGAPADAAPSDVPAHRTISGVVTANRPDGATELRTDGGVLILRPAQPPPEGTRVVFEVLGRSATAPMSVREFAATTLGNLLTHWPALRDVMQALPSAESAAVAQAIAAIPQTGPRLSAGLVLFLRALVGGDLRQWLGRDAAPALERLGHTLLPQRLGEEFTQLARLAQTPMGNDWRAIPVPLLHDGALHQIRLYLHRPPRRAPDDDAESLRFVVEAGLSHIGPLQLDGLVRGAKFDLVVRTTEALPERIRDGIAEIFTSAREAAEAPGRIAFQVADPFPVDPAGMRATDAVRVVA